jgi:hypothetical protein
MSLISLVVALVVVGFLLWLFNTYIPMNGAIKGLLNIVVVVGVAVWLLQGFGIVGPLDHLQLNDVHFNR